MKQFYYLFFLFLCSGNVCASDLKDALSNTSWELTTIVNNENTYDVLKYFNYDLGVNLVFSENKLQPLSSLSYQGYNGCNHFYGDLKFLDKKSPNQVKFTNEGMTLMACMDHGKSDAFAKLYPGKLYRTSSIALTDNRLELTNKKQKVSFIFKLLPNKKPQERNVPA